MSSLVPKVAADGQKSFPLNLHSLSVTSLVHLEARVRAIIYSNISFPRDTQSLPLRQTLEITIKVGSQGRFRRSLCYKLFF